jgi:hypothetical protein
MRGDPIGLDDRDGHDQVDIATLDFPDRVRLTARVRSRRIHAYEKCRRQPQRTTRHSRRTRPHLTSSAINTLARLRKKASSPTRKCPIASLR